jgi:immune inhibitor A
VIPASGTHMWLANRGNWSNVRLMREFDLTAVDTATLEYAVYRDIEEGYDFAYVSVSTDGGQTWQGLIGEQMQGLSAGDDPSNSAYLDRFYTGQGRDWEQETADLTPYAGQVIQVRFEYVTDPILTFGGLAIDNISIPEIDFYDDAETDNGWIAEGFVRATGYVPQQWHLQLITFDGGAPVVQHIELSEDNTVSLDLSLDGAEDEPILIVAASAPMTLEPAYYLLEIQ